MTHHTHACVLCGQHYDCDGSLERNHDGWPDPVCVTQTEPNIDFQMCEGCRRFGCCERCEDQPAIDEQGYCATCQQTVAEEQHEARIADYYGASTPQTELEHYAEAAKIKREQR